MPDPTPALEAVGIFDLWLPIVVSAVAVFFMSFLFWMVTGHHKSDWKPVGDEDKLMDTISGLGLGPGMYTWPHCDDPSKMDDAFKAKFEKGPCGWLTILPPGPFTMGPALQRWFLYSLVTGVVTAYICTTTSLTHAGMEFMDVFQVAGAVSFICYSWAHIPDSIWKGVPWVVTFKNVIDGLVYGILTGLAFAIMWPSA